MIKSSPLISFIRILLISVFCILAYHYVILSIMFKMDNFYILLSIFVVLELIFAFIYYKTKNKYIYLLCLFLLYILINLVVDKILISLVPASSYVKPYIETQPNGIYAYTEVSPEYASTSVISTIISFFAIVVRYLLPFILCYHYEHKFYNVRIYITINLVRGLFFSFLFVWMFLLSKTGEIFLSGEYIWIILLICGLLLLCISLIYKKTKNKYVYLIGLYVFYLLLVAVYNGFLILLMAHPEQGFLFLLYAIIFICLMAVILCFYYEYKFFNMSYKAFKIISTICLSIIALQSVHHIILKIIYTFS